jgi:hypothetical protein
MPSASAIEDPAQRARARGCCGLRLRFVPTGELARDLDLPRPAAGDSASQAGLVARFRDAILREIAEARALHRGVVPHRGVFLGRPSPPEAGGIFVVLAHLA